MRSRLWTIIGLASLAGVVIIYTLGWWLISTLARQAIEEEIAARRDAGITIAFRDMARSGFPFTVMWTLSDLEFETVWKMEESAFDGIVKGSADQLSLSFPLWSPDRLSSVVETTSLDFIPDNKQTPLQIKVARIAYDNPEPPEPGHTVNTITLTEVKVDGGGAAIAQKFTVSAGEIMSRIRSATPEATDHGADGKADHDTPAHLYTITVTGLDARDLSSSPARKPVFDEPGAVTFKAALHGHLDGFEARDLSAWRDEGGTFELTLFDVAWSPFGMQAEGTFALDEALRPMGSGVVHLRGLEDLVERRAGSNLMSRADALATRLAIRLLPRAEGAIRLPLTIQGGKVRAGSFPLGTLGPLVR